MRRHLPTLLRLALLAVAGFYLVRLAKDYAHGLAGVPLEADVVGLLGASVLWVASYVLLVGLWARSMTWWGARVEIGTALRVFAAANIARYIPGGIWQFATLASMSVARGLSVASVVSAALFQQITLASVGAVLAIHLAPTTRLGAFTVPVPVVSAALVAAILVLVLLLPALTRRVDEWLSRRRAVNVTLPRVRRQDIALYVVVTAVGWVGYATAFVVFTDAFLRGPMPSPVMLGASFVMGYVAGIFAVFAPGGLIVREAALLALLTPALGGERALALALGSRLWLTVIDALTSFILLLPARASVDSRLP